MKECVREHEIVEAVTSGRWPEACDPELRTHAMSCAICKDVVLVATALHEERDVAVSNAPVTPAGLVWWRAELRARREAVRVAERPMTVVHALAAAAVVGVTLALVGGLLPTLINLPELGLLAGGFATLLVVAPIALYFVFSDK